MLAAIIVAVILMNGGGGGSAFVPQVDGMTWPQAEAAIKTAGLVPVEHKVPSASVQSGLVISTNPDNGNSAPKGSTVTVNVSTGVQSITLPNLQGAQATAAEQQLKNLGFTNVNPVPDAQSTQPAGTVDHMTPAPGKYPPDQQITLYVSGGGVKVPNVVNQTAVVAQSILRQDGFTVQTVSTPAPASEMVQPGTVYNQNPAANAIEPKGTLIQIFVQPQTTDTGSPTATGSPTTTGQPTAPTSPTDHADRHAGAARNPGHREQHDGHRARIPACRARPGTVRGVTPQQELPGGARCLSPASGRSRSTRPRRRGAPSAWLARLGSRRR